jgi:hypothetical protein
LTNFMLNFFLLLALNHFFVQNISLNFPIRHQRLSNMFFSVENFDI